MKVKKKIDTAVMQFNTFVRRAKKDREVLIAAAREIPAIVRANRAKYSGATKALAKFCMADARTQFQVLHTIRQPQPVVGRKFAEAYTP